MDSTGTSANTALHYYHLVVNFRQMNCVLREHLLAFHFSESIFRVFFQCESSFLGFSEIPNSADPGL